MGLIADGWLHRTSLEHRAGLQMVTILPFNLGLLRLVATHCLFATGKSTLISSLEKGGEAMGLALSPHGRSILFVQNEFSESNIMLNNFR